MADKPKLPIVDDLNVREIFCSKFLSAITDGQSISLMFGAQRFVPETTASPPPAAGVAPVVVTARLVLTPAAANELMGALGQLAAVLSRPANPKEAN